MSHTDPPTDNTPPPDAGDFPPEDNRIGRIPAIAFSALFLLLLAVPPLWQDIVEWRKGEDGWLPARELIRAVRGEGAGDKPVAARLRDFDAGVARLGFTEAPRRAAQQVATALLGRGNDRSVPGRDGWLFFRPEIEALTGYGPLVPEPHSVSRDPSLLSWHPALGPMLQFASDLRDRGVGLWLVPAPMKPSIYPEMLTGESADGPVRHPDAAAFFARLEAGGIRVIDPAGLLWNLKADDAEAGPVYLRHDTHWSPRGMEAVAGLVAREIGKEPWYSAPAEVPGPLPATASAPDFGDLVEKLDPWDPDRLFGRQQVPLHRIPDSALARADRSSPLVLLGDSFVNVFDDPALGFAPADLPDGERIRAGFAQQLAWRLQMPIDVYAMNGEGASGVRAAFARRGDESVRARKLVVWVIAERDLFLGRTAARRNGVEWETTTFAPGGGTPGPPPESSGDAPLVVEATVVEKSDQADPRRANYPDSLYVVEYKIERTVSGGGAAAGDTIYVVHWNFRDRKSRPSASLGIGDTRTLTLTPWDNELQLQTLNLTDDFDDPAPRWYSAE